MQTKKYFYYIVQRGGKLFSSPLEEEHLFSRPITEDLLKHFSSFIRSKSFILSTNQKKCLYSLNQSKTSFYSLSSNRKKTAILPSTPRKSSAVSPVIVVSANQIKFQIPSLLLFFFFFQFQLPAVVGASCHRASSIIKSLVLVHPYFSCTTSIPTKTKES